jgi:calcineurin-like phosphoesterase family protein
VAEIWFVSDHHFQHKKILELTDKHNLILRPEFDSVEDMNEAMIDNHNALVRDEDTVWFLGDVCWKENKESKEILRRMKGHKNLTPGNHDNIKFLYPFFEEIVLWKKFPEHDIMLSHVPLVGNDMVRTKYNVHGHLHEVDVLGPDGTPDLHYMNVCVEQTGYMPVSLWQVKEFLRPS